MGCQDELGWLSGVATCLSRHHTGACMVSDLLKTASPDSLSKCGAISCQGVFLDANGNVAEGPNMNIAMISQDGTFIVRPFLAHIIGTGRFWPLSSSDHEPMSL